MKMYKTYGLILLIVLSELNYAQLKNFKHGEVARTYLIHLPPNYNANNNYPLVFVFHGWTHTPAITETHTKMSIKADDANFIAVYPAGIIGSNKEWNENDKYTVDDVGFIKELLDTLIMDYSIDTTKIYASGFSDGAGMACRMAYELPNRIAAIACIAGSLDGTKYNPTKATPTILFRAKNDGSYSATAVNSIVSFWKTLNTSVSNPDTIFMNDDALGVQWKGDGDMEFILYTTKIGGHSWPGGNTSFAVPSQAISASDLLWDFFVAHPLIQNTTDVNEGTTNIGNFQYMLYQNYPNPFNPNTQISFSLPENNNVCLKVYNMLGEEVITLINGNMNKGFHTINLSMNNMPSGVYIYSITSGNFRDTKKLLLLK